MLGLLSMVRKKTIIMLLVVFLVLPLGLYYYAFASTKPTTVGPTPITDHRDLPSSTPKVSMITDGLFAPWAFTWLPNGDILVTEKAGTMRLIQNGVVQSEPISGVPKVYSAGQAGLLDVILHPQFDENRFVYFSYSHGSSAENRLRVARAKLNDKVLEGVEVIFEVAQNKQGTSHFGSRFQWLPDGTLVIAVGDGGNPPAEFDGKLIREQAQNLQTHFGKLIRINDDGSIPDDNPFIGRDDVRPEIWSFGHRNVQGIAYDKTRNKLLASEHGSRGGDELNVVEAGKNYGWPLTTYSVEYNTAGDLISPHQALDGMEDPVAVWTPSIAPSDMVHYTGDKYDDWQGDFFLAGMLLRKNASILAYMSSASGAVFRIRLDEHNKVIDQERIIVGDFRVRDVDQGPDGFLYVLTSPVSGSQTGDVNHGALWKIESKG